MTKSSWRPYVVLGIGLLAIYAAAILIRFAQNDGAPSLVISAWRLGLAALVITPFALSRHREELRKIDRKTLGLMLISGVFLGAHFATWITSLEYTSVTSSVVLVSTTPIWVVMAAPFLLRERLGMVSVIAVFIAMVGAVIVTITGNAGTAPHQDAPLLGNILAVIGAIAVGGYYMIGRRVRATVSLIPYTWITYGIAAIVMVIAVLITGQRVIGLSSDAYFWMTLIALVPQLIGHSAYNYALGYLSAAYVSLTILSEPIGSTILAAILLAEQPTGGQLVGGAVVLIALFIASREESQAIRRAEQEASVVELVET